MRILVVEDDPDIRMTLEHFLLDAGHEVDAVGTGHEALKQTAAAIPDMVLLDRMLPDIPGTDVCRALRAAPATKTVAVIIVSARRGEEDRIFGLEQGADDYVEKPFSLRELLLRIEAVVRRARRTSLLANEAERDRQGRRADAAAAEAVAADRRRARAGDEIRGWEGYSRLHFERGEWRECREISRALLREHGDLLTVDEANALRERIRRCDERVAGTQAAVSAARSS